MLRAIAAILVCAPLLAGCGIKGPLRLPPAPSPAAAAPAAAAEAAPGDAAAPAEPAAKAKTP